MKTFIGENKPGIIVNIDVENTTEQILMDWLENKHNDIFWDIEMHEGGSVHINKWVNEVEIMFMGDNGIFILNSVEVELIK